MRFWEAEGLVSPAVCLSVTCLSSEQGDFLVLELGATGASLRVLWVTLTGTEEPQIEPRSQEFLIPQELMLGPGQKVRALCQGSGTAGWPGLRGAELSASLNPRPNLHVPQLFDFAAHCLSEFLDACPVGDRTLQLGFNFSFPCHQTGLDRVRCSGHADGGEGLQPCEGRCRSGPAFLPPEHPHFLDQRF